MGLPYPPAPEPSPRVGRGVWTALFLGFLTSPLADQKEPGGGSVIHIELAWPVGGPDAGRSPVPRTYGSPALTSR